MQLYISSLTLFGNRLSSRDSARWRGDKNKKEEIIFSISKFYAVIDALAAAGSSSRSSSRSSNSSCHLPNNFAHYDPAEATV